MGETGAVTAQVFDVAVRRVASLKGRAGAPLAWSGKGQDGRPVAAGIYLYRVDVARNRVERKVVVV